MSSRLTYKQLKGLSVETVSGSVLGHVHDLVLEMDGQLVAQYVVRASVLRGQEYLVSRDQVVRFEVGRLVVDDSVRQAEGRSSDIRKKISLQPEPLAMRDVE